MFVPHGYTVQNHHHSIATSSRPNLTVASNCKPMRKKLMEKLSTFTPVCPIQTAMFYKRRLITLVAVAEKSPGGFGGIRICGGWIGWRNAARQWRWGTVQNTPCHRCIQVCATIMVGVMGWWWIHCTHTATTERRWSVHIRTNARWSGRTKTTANDTNVVVALSATWYWNTARTLVH